MKVCDSYEARGKMIDPKLTADQYVTDVQSSRPSLRCCSLQVLGSLKELKTRSLQFHMLHADSYSKMSNIASNQMIAGV